MNCINCGAEIKSEYNNCPHCGKSLQIVPDYSVYDDDDINVLLESAKNVESKNNKAYIRAQKEKERQEAFESKKKQQTKKTVIIVAIVCVVLLVAAIIGKIIIDVNNASSYDYQMKMADNAMFKENYEEAEKFYLNALELEPNDIDARLELADLYLKTEDTDEAIRLLKEAISLDPSNNNIIAYNMLFEIYHKAGDVDAVLELKKGITDSKILLIFKEYEVRVPNISLEAGTYSDAISISFSADQNTEIYYTLDGSDPTTYGKRYTSAINIDEAGMHTVKVVAKNALGIYSEVISSTYVIEYEAPADPVVSPDGGEFTNEQSITIIVPDGCSAYYTWDGTDPTELSTLYVSPIKIPEGYNILSVIIIDNKTGLKSGIYRGAFEYHVN